MVRDVFYTSASVPYRRRTVGASDRSYATRGFLYVPAIPLERAIRYSFIKGGMNREYGVDETKGLIEVATNI